MKNKILKLIDFNKIDTVLEGFKNTTGLATAILDLEGTVLSQSEWRKLCANFYLKNPETANWCSTIKIELSEKLAEGEDFNLYKSSNGLVEVAIPILINGEHFANLFSGLFFYEDPDFSIFEKEGKQYGFDEKGYIEALNVVPIIPAEKIKTIMDFLLGTVQFIIELATKKVEQMDLNNSLAISKLLVESIIDNSPSLIYVADIEGKLKLANKEFQKLFPLQKSDLVGKYRQDIMPAAIAEQHRNNDLAVIHSKKSITIEEENLEDDEKHFYISQKFPLFDLDGTVHAVGGISTDITEKKRTEEALRKNKNKYKSLFENSADGILVLNEQSEILELNNKICEILEYTREELILLKRFEFIHSEDLANKDHVAALEELQQGKTLLTQYRLRKKNGSYIPAELSTKMIGEGQFLNIVRDITERKEAENLLLESEKMLSVIFNNHTDLQLLVSIDKNQAFRIDAINKPYITTAAQFGITINADTIVGQPIRKLFELLYLSDEIYETSITKYKKAATSGKSINYTESIVILGQIYTSEITLNPVMNENGICQYILYNSHNITDQTLANSALKESEEKFKQIFLTSPDFVTISQIEDGTYLNINDRFIQTFGYTREEIIGKTSIDLNIWNDPEDRKHMLAQLTQYGKVENLNATFKLKNGLIIDGLISASILLIKNKPHLLTITRDITELKLAEKLSSETQSKLYSALNSMTDAVFISDVNGNFIDFNDAFATFHKFKNKVECAKSFAEYPDIINAFFPNGKLAPVEMWAVPRALRGEIATNAEYSMQRKDTGEIWVGSYSFSPIRDENNEIVGSVVVGRDITEIKKAEIALNESNERLKVILENTPIAIWDWDLQTDKWFATSKYFTMLGYENENSIPDRTIWLNRVHPDYRETVTNQIRGILDQSKDSYSYDAPMLHADGSYRWHSVIGQIIEFDENNCAKRMIGVRIDINEQKLAEEAFKETAANLRSIIFNREDLIWSIDCNFNYIIFNSAYEKIINNQFNIEIKKGMSIIENLIPEQAIFWTSKFKSVFEGESVTFEFSKELNNEIRYFQTSLNPIIEDTIITGASGLSIDITKRKIIEEALKLSEEKFEKSFRLSPFMISLSTLDGQVIDVNDRVFSTLGYTREEFLGSNTTVLPVWVNLKERETFTSLLKKDESLHEMEVKFRKKSGEIGDYFVSACIIEVNERELFLSIIHDITERKQKEKALKESEERYRDLFENSYAVMLLIDPENGNIVGANPAASMFYGWSNSELVSMNINQLNAKTNEEIKEVLKHASKNNQNHFFFDHVLADSTIRNIEAYSAPIFIDGKKILYSILHDVTDRNLAEKALVNEKNLLSTIIENIPVMLTRYDPGTNMVYLNKEFENKIGWKTDDLKSINLMEKVYPDPKYREEALAYMQNLSTNWKEFLIHSKNGKAIDSEWCNIRLDDGTQIGIGIDITEEKKSKAEIIKLNTELESTVKLRTAQLEAINKELGTFTYSVSHDLKAPLRGIDGYSKLLADIYKPNLNQEAQSFIEKIRSSTLQMNQIIDDLLDYSRLERSQLNIGQVKIKDLIESVLSVYNAELEGGYFKLNTEITDIEIIADAKGFIIAFRNLIENAIKFTKGKTNPTIKIGFEEKELSWIISVNDNGIGFDMQYHHKIFDIFQRLQRAEDYPGTGIGLALVSKAMQRMHGKTWAESIPNVGSTFYLEIPKNQ